METKTGRQVIGLVTVFGLIESKPGLNRFLPNTAEVRFQDEQNRRHQEMNPESDIELHANRAGHIVLYSAKKSFAGIICLSNIQDELISLLRQVTLVQTFESREAKDQYPKSFREKLELRFSAGMGNVNVLDFSTFLRMQRGEENVGFQILLNPSQEGEQANICLFFNPNRAPKGAKLAFKEGGSRFLRFHKENEIVSYEVPKT